jgi:hypothetical protein
VPRPENAELYKKYQALTAETPNVHFVGRLATYKYYNMDQVVAQSLTLFKKIIGSKEHENGTQINGHKLPSCNPEVWGGIECTINRVQDVFRDQLLYSGHYSRPGDIERFAELGIKKIRYPLLWEFHQPVENTL